MRSLFNRAVTLDADNLHVEEGHLDGVLPENDYSRQFIQKSLERQRDEEEQPYVTTLVIPYVAELG